jgi:glycosyltransferase involved in cell wall biosynthesis
MRILLLCTYDLGGGAEKVALDLLRVYRARGHDARLAVRYKRTDTAEVFEIDPYQRAAPWAKLCRLTERWVRQRSRFRGQYHVVDWLRRMALPRRWLDHWRGVEDFNYPYSWRLLDNSAWQPDVIHAHNLHGDYFDLRAMAALSRRVPCVWTLHDAWAITGHCGHFADIGCNSWLSGCGRCPDLKRPPALLRDGTAANWHHKRRIYDRSRLAVATPSRWLMEYVRASSVPFQPMRVIPNGIDLTIYRPAGRQRARQQLGLSQDAFICLSVTFGKAATTPYKDLATVENAVHTLRTQTHLDNVLFVGIGGQSSGIIEPWVRYTGYLTDVRVVACYYQAADVLLHAAHVDSFPLTVLEAMACGTPVIATAVGGIPEQIEHQVTGLLVPRGDSNQMAEQIQVLMQQPELRQQMGLAATQFASRYFSLERQATAYLEWFDALRVEYGAIAR